MNGIFFLAWRYLAYHKVKTAILVAAVATIVYLPAALDIVVRRSARELNARARATPLLVGAQGSPLELVLNSLYFESGSPPPTTYSEVERVQRSGLARAIPVDARFRAGRSPIVGTTLDYFEFRRLTLDKGRVMALLGECVLGAAAARTAGVAPGGYVVSAPENVLDLAGTYPLKMRVVGVFQPTGTPDDLAVFVDLKTAWVIDGRAHGHQDLSRPEASPGVLRTEGARIVANASVIEYNEITPENVGTFHFHGDPATFPLTGVIAIPRDAKAGTLLQGRYLKAGERVQIVRPEAVLAQLLGTVFTVRSYVLAAALLLGLATLATMSLVFSLSFQLRRRELQAIVKIGGSRHLIAGLISAEIVAVLAAGVSLAAGLSALTSWFATALLRMFVLLA